MSYTLAFLPVAWEDYQHWHQTDKGVFRRINALLKDMQRTPFAGIGKPELLGGVLLCVEKKGVRDSATL